MASGHVNRAKRPNTRLHRPTCYVKKALANSEPSTHGAAQAARSMYWPPRDAIDKGAQAPPYFVLD
jgi:hypothetical protein